MTIKRITFFSGTITSKGQITIPRQIRRLLGLQKQQKLFLHTDGSRIIISQDDPETAQPLTTGRPNQEEIIKTAGGRYARKQLSDRPL
jgi:AbrB family looped-hinge helix DNA binding protein